MNRAMSVAVATGSFLAAASSVSAQDSVADFYKGARMKMIVGSDTGGGYDSLSRLFALHVTKHIPGGPSMIVQNMPGGGGVAAANYMYNVAPKDGSVIANIQRQIPFLAIMGKPGPKFVAEQFNWIGSLNNEVIVCVSMKPSKVATYADLLKQDLVIGGSGQNDTETVPAMLNNTLGTRFKIVSGYPSSTAITLAMERGEVEGLCPSYSSLQTRNAQWLKDNRVNILIQASTRKHPDLPNVPLALELAKDPETRALLELNDARLEIGRPYLAPPDVPADRVKVLRDALMATTTDPEMVADLKKQKRDLTPVSGENVQSLIERVARTDKAVLAKLDDALVYRGTKEMANPKQPAK